MWTKVSGKGLAGNFDLLNGNFRLLNGHLFGICREVTFVLVSYHLVWKLCTTK